MIIPDNPDLFILEFGVNDYQGQDHKVHLDHKTNIFFNGFERLALCCEVVIYKLLTKYPNAAILFLEFQTAILNRKTAQLLHLGVAQHYHIPMISYSNVMFPQFYNLIHRLDSKKYYSTYNNDTILQYPHGCQPCLHQHIIEQFREHGCKSICVYMERSGYICPSNAILPINYTPCYVSFLSHDAVHPSTVGHQIAHDLIVDFIALTAKDICIQNKNIKDKVEHFYKPKQIGFIASSEMIQHYSEYIVVKDTMQMFAEHDPLIASSHSKGFQLTGDGFGDRKGWIATNPNGNEYIEFIIDLPIDICYVVTMSLLKSYENMGTFTISMIDLITNHTISIDGDGIWEPHISIPADFNVNDDYDIIPACTGQCKIKIIYHQS